LDENSASTKVGKAFRTKTAFQQKLERHFGRKQHSNKSWKGISDENSIPTKVGKAFWMKTALQQKLERHFG
jgi:hypothetical protein